MKGGSLNGLRGKQFLLTIIVLMCTSIFLWGWEKTPLITTYLAQEDEFEIPSPDVDDDSSSAVKEKETRVDQGEQSFNEQEVDMEEHSSIAAEVRETNTDQPGPIFDKDERMDVAHMGDGTTSFLGETEGCKYGKGKWVLDSRRPLYSGFSCKQWLSEMWACRLTQRTDFSYEGFRWQPQNCEMPEFEGSAFLRKMQDKSLALVGDSLGRQQFQSLMCMITGGKEELEVEDVGREYGLVKTRGAIRPDGWAYRFPRTNTTILYYWSACLCELEPLNINDPHTEYAMHLDRPATFLREFLHRFDVLVLNTGHHWNRGKLRGNRWVMYVGGKPNQDKAIAEMGNAKNFTVYSISKWLDSQLPNYPRLKVFFRTISPRHFVNGDWNSGGSCDNNTPLAGGNEVSQEESSDSVVEGAVRGTGVKLLDITALSQLRDECHISRYSVKATEGMQDCLHWCLPGVPDTWNEILSAQI